MHVVFWFAPLNAITFIQPRYCNTIINIIIYMPISPAKTHILNRINEDLSVIHIFYHNAHFPSRHILDPNNTTNTTWAASIYTYFRCVHLLVLCVRQWYRHVRSRCLMIVLHQIGSILYHTMLHNTTKRLRLLYQNDVQNALDSAQRAMVCGWLNERAILLAYIDRFM